LATFTFKGRLIPGSIGDVTVFEIDLDAVPAEAIGQVQVDHTIIDGRMVYSR
jgi:predicted amidohydrolase YtcJ